VTPQRFRRIESVLRRRQPDLTVVMENVHKGHNFSAVLRTCDAAGIFEAHAVLPHLRGVSQPGFPPVRTRRWVRAHKYGTIEEATAVVRHHGCQVLAAHLSEEAVDFRSADYTRPTAILLGQEKFGVTNEGLACCDGQIVIPMQGMTESLNVSVAAAVILAEAQRQRQAVGLYETCRIDPEIYRTTLFEWAHPKIADLCQRRNVAYPELDEEGNIMGPVPR